LSHRSKQTTGIATRVAVLVCFGLAAQLHAQTPSRPTPLAADDCSKLGFGDFAARRGVLLRIARADPAALSASFGSVDCFTMPELEPLSRAAGEFFDVRPRDYLLGLAEAAAQPGSRVVAAEWLHALRVLPVRLIDDFVRLDAMARRVGFYDAHVVVLPPKLREPAGMLFGPAIGTRVDAVAAKLPPVKMMSHPLIALEFPLNDVRVAPASLNVLRVEDQLHSTRQVVLAEHRVPGSRENYSLVSAFSLVYSRAEPPRPVDLESDGWVVREKSGEPLKVFDAEDQFYSLPVEVVAGLCESAVWRMADLFGRKEGLQAALDAHVVRNPTASLRAPLRKAFETAGYDVRRYQALDSPAL
jgi:hypothetical protein